MTCELVIFDWAGTLIDHGCRAPLVAFLDAFEACGLPIDEATARKPMGAHKRDHVVEILGEPAVADRARALLCEQAGQQEQRRRQDPGPHALPTAGGAPAYKNPQLRRIQHSPMARAFPFATLRPTPCR